ncbi:MAG: hypothetical protein H7A23_12305 [Leptospiraceae bacterium]|nr:hypothetical protein [Leptospiraceae bacterium]MCP5495330.1 hypothetical protein [Leptospiraceae bacterium]
MEKSNSLDVQLKIELYDVFLLLCKGQFNSVKKYFETMSLEKLVDIEVVTSQNEEVNALFLYYLWMLRDEKSIQGLINDRNFPTSLLIKYIYYGYGQWIRAGNDADNFFMESLQFLTVEKIKELLENSFDVIFGDGTLLLFLISRLNRMEIEEFFQHSHYIENITDFFLELFNSIEGDQVGHVFFKNHDLYSYVIQLFQSMDPSSKKYQRFFQKHRDDLEIVEKLNCLIEELNTKYDLEKERHLSPSARNKNRLMEIIREISKFQNIKEIVFLLNSKGIFIDDGERETVYNILINDFLNSRILGKVRTKVA